MGHSAGPFVMYAGNAGLCKELFADFPINTDDRPLIEYLAPIAERNVGASQENFMISVELIRFYEELFEHLAPEQDPFLKHLDQQ